jgi:hypothetical protein
LSAVLAVTSICGCQRTPTSAAEEYRRITVTEYVDKMKAGWIGQMAGVGWGAPTEFKYLGRIIPVEEVPEWTPEMVNQFEQDDVYVEMTFLRTLEQYGYDVDIRQAGIDFANSRYQLWFANHAGRENLRAGIAPPWSGHPAYSEHADDIDYQIESDYAGLIAPGIPQVAVDLGDKFGHLMSYGDGVYGGQFVACMYTEAFFESDPEQIIRAALKCIPQQSAYAAAIRDVLDWHEQHPDDFEETWSLIEAKYQDDVDNRRCSSLSSTALNIDVKINGAYVVMGLLYGKGDLDATIVAAMRGGQDSDCNPSSAAGVLFTTVGMSNLPDKFTSALDLEQVFSYTSYNLTSLTQVCEKLARAALTRNGGRVETNEEGEEVFVIPLREPLPGALEQCWAPGPVPEDVHFTAAEMSQITVAR